MASSENEKIEILHQTIETATIVRKAGGRPRPARFILVPQPQTDVTELSDRITQTLSVFGAVVRSDQSGNPPLLKVTLNGRVSKNDAPLAFEAAYAFLAAFEVQAAEPDLLTDVFVDDPARTEGRAESIDYIPFCWADEDPEIDRNKHWALDAMRVKQAWDIAGPERAGGAGIVVAQIDSGLTEHSELEGIRQHAPRDTIDEDNDARDPMNAWSLSEGHGTATASVLFSPPEGDVLGCAPRATLMPIRAITSVVRVSQVDVAEGINHAVANGAHVVTMSLGGLPSISLGRAVRNAVDNNVIVLAAAGNCIRFVTYPARYDDCLAIGGSNRQGSNWRGSCRGSSVAFSAPAENVYRARAFVKDGQVEYDTGQGQGTSFAVALVAGVAACWLAHHGRDHLLQEAKKNGETLQQMFGRLAEATAAKPPGWNAAFGAGIINAEALLREPLNRGADEGAVGPSSDEAFADSIRALAFEATKDEKILDNGIDWKVIGPEVALSIFERMKKTKRPVGPEEAAPPVPTSEGSRFLQNAIQQNPGLGSLFK